MSIFSALVIVASFFIVKFDKNTLSGFAIALLTTLGAFIHSLSLALAVNTTLRRKISFIVSSMLAQSIIPVLILLFLSPLDIASDSVIAVIIICILAISICGSVYFIISKYFLLPYLGIDILIKCILYCQFSLMPILFFIIFDPPNFYNSTEISRYSFVITSSIIWWYAFSLGLTHIGNKITKT